MNITSDCTACNIYDMKETCSKTKGNVTNRKFNVLTLNVEFISLVRHDFVILSLVLRIRENIKNRLPREINSIFNVKPLTLLYAFFVTRTSNKT